MNALKDTSRACPESGGVRSGLMWSAMLTGATYVFPLIVYPYVSRVLGVADIGLVGFIDSVVTWFILISMMGISILGIRETAKVQGSPEGLGRVLTGLLAVNGVMTLVCLVAMASVTVAVPQLREHWRLMGVGMCKLMFNLFIVEWFWRGIGEFRYITVRTVVVRAAYVVAVFLTVKGPDDTLLYYFLTMTVVAVTAAVNMWRTRRHAALTRRLVSFRRLAEEARRHARSFFSLGTYMLLTAFW